MSQPERAQQPPPEPRMEIQVEESQGSPVSVPKDASHPNSRVMTVETPLLEDRGHWVHRKQDSIRLGAEQERALALIMSEAPLATIQGPFGTGKTTLTAYAARKAVHLGYKVLILTQSHTDSARMTEVVQGMKLDGPEARILRQVPGIFLDNGATLRTSVDIPTLLADLPQLEYVKGRLTEEEESCWKAWKHQCLIMDMPLEDQKKMVHLESEEDVVQAGESFTRLQTRLIKMLTRLTSTNIIVTTPDVILANSNFSGAFRDLPWSYNLLLVDSASRVSDRLFTRLDAQFGMLRQRYIGDNAFLPPPDEWDDTLSAVRTPISALQVLDRKKVPTAMLKYSYRSHPGITNFLAEAFYNDTIIAAAATAQRSRLLDELQRSQTTTPLITVNAEQPTKPNPEVADKAQCGINTTLLIAEWLLRHNFKPEEILIVYFEKSQASALLEYQQRSGILALPADSMQGFEYAVAVLVPYPKTTGADHPPAYFSSQILALTRATMGIFVVIPLDDQREWSFLKEVTSDQQTDFAARFFATDI